MHEFSITQSMVEICEQNARGRKVSLVMLELGSLSGVIPEAVSFCFEACTKGTVLEGAKLVIEQVVARGRCGVCGTETVMKSFYDPCGSCGGFGLEILAGEELRVREIEVE